LTLPEEPAAQVGPRWNPAGTTRASVGGEERGTWVSRRGAHSALGTPSVSSVPWLLRFPEGARRAYGPRIVIRKSRFVLGKKRWKSGSAPIRRQVESAKSKLGVIRRSRVSNESPCGGRSLLFSSGSFCDRASAGSQNECSPSVESVVGVRVLLEQRKPHLPRWAGWPYHMELGRSGVLRIAGDVEC